MRRVGLDVTRQTLWDQSQAVYHALLPTILALHTDILGSDLVHADETTWRVMRKGNTQKWWVWSVTSDRGVYYQIVPSRDIAAALTLSEGYDGTVMADGFVVYAALAKARTRQGDIQLVLQPDGSTVVEDQPDGSMVVDNLPDFLLVICWVHARRPLWKAEKNYPECTAALDLIARLYEIEDRAAKEAINEEDLLQRRAHLRNVESREVIAAIDLWRKGTRALPKSQLARGLTFLENQWPGLIALLEDPTIPLDNSEAERHMRPVVLGRNNHVGSRSEAGTRVSAAMYSLVESAKIHQVNPRDYLNVALRRALEEPGNVLLPRQYAAEVWGTTAATPPGPPSAAPDGEPGRRPEPDGHLDPAAASATPQREAKALAPKGQLPRNPALNWASGVIGARVSAKVADLVAKIKGKASGSAVPRDSNAAAARPPAGAGADGESGAFTEQTAQDGTSKEAAAHPSPAQGTSHRESPGTPSGSQAPTGPAGVNGKIVASTKKEANVDTSKGPTVSEKPVQATVPKHPTASELLAQVRARKALAAKAPGDTPT